MGEALVSLLCIAITQVSPAVVMKWGCSVLKNDCMSGGSEKNSPIGHANMLVPGFFFYICDIKFNIYNVYASHISNKELSILLFLSQEHNVSWGNHFPEHTEAVPLCIWLVLFSLSPREIFRVKCLKRMCWQVRRCSLEVLALLSWIFWDRLGWPWDLTVFAFVSYVGQERYVVAVSWSGYCSLKSRNLPYFEVYHVA